MASNFVEEADTTTTASSTRKQTKPSYDQLLAKIEKLESKLWAVEVKNIKLQSLVNELKAELKNLGWVDETDEEETGAAAAAAATSASDESSNDGGSSSGHDYHFVDDSADEEEVEIKDF